MLKGWTGRFFTWLAIHGPKPYEFIGFGDIHFWKVFYIENSRFALDALRVANRSPTPTSKTNDFLGPFDVILGVRGRRSRPIWGVPGVRAGIQSIYF